MKIKKYFDIYYKDMIVNHNHSVKDIVENSKMASLNSVFVAIRGYKHNGINFIEEAIMDVNNNLYQYVLINYEKDDFIEKAYEYIELSEAEYEKVKKELGGI